MQPNCLHDNSALTQSGHAAGWGSHSPTCDPNLLAVILAVYGFSGEKRADSSLPTHTLELLHKRSDLLKRRLLLGEVLRVQSDTAQQAKDVVAHRDTYLNDIVSDGAGPLWEAR